VTSIAFYWHNGRTLGHTSGSAKIAQGLVREPDLDVGLLGITGAVHGLDLFPESMDILRLPSFKNFDGDPALRPVPRIRMTAEELFALRTELISVLFRHVEVDALVVNHFIRGFYDELVPVLAGPRSYPAILSLRGILWDKQKTQRQYLSGDAVDWIDRTFDHICLHIDERVFRFEEFYDVPRQLRSRIRYMGYLAEPTSDAREQVRSALGLENSERLVVANLGGGEGTVELWRQVLAAIELNANQFDRAVLVAGPYMRDDEYAELATAVRDERVSCQRYRPDVASLIQAADLFIGAAGSGTVAEVLAARANAILIPRLVIDAAEQELHAARLAALGLIRTRSRADVCSQGLTDLVAAALAEPVQPITADLLGGPSRYRDLLCGLGGTAAGASNPARPPDGGLSV
jgi:predicted glycosyltransferase